MPQKFQRARSEEQRAARREAILDTAADMLAEMPVAQVSLNELSRRVGLAKSNVLRYFESREDVLLELLGSATRELVGHLETALAEAAGPAEPAGRADRLAARVARALADRPVLCDLISAQAAVLERNVSPQVAAQFKRAAIANATALAGLVATHLPELGQEDAFRFVAATVMVTGSVWAHAQPCAAMLTVYEEDPALAVFRLDFEDTLRETLEVLLSGLLARAERARLGSWAVGEPSEER
ncbi:TetR family transcriptional regulator [Streptomyces goshikiensis]|uniref:TetR/AcrR family transcriptional regulator n=1 Tax=Streptomyces TaxID=1883 RepID=UPI00093F62B6|nr:MULTISPECIES: TetR/AcrR family transcriptional regulator [Streptomyces]MBP0933095.1 TetR family transcriptional regulator [Streptomyces sp. KCTC 0041BP]OKI40929.1 TetR family transcriptional regulator [Streptomyces sp. CB03578]